MSSRSKLPQLGDYLRNIMARLAPDWSTFHMTLNRNKRSVTCDARATSGKKIIGRAGRGRDIFSPVTLATRTATGPRF